MYSAPPSAHALAAWGLLLSDVEAVEVFEENRPSFDLFLYMGSQWRTGMSGAIGFDYNVAHHRLDRMKLDPVEYEVRMDDLRVMEAAVLSTLRTQQKEK